MRKRVYEIIRGDSRLSELYGRAMTAVILASLLPLCFHDDAPWALVLEYACVAVFVADYAARWVTADYSLGKGAASFALYPFTPMAIIDLLTILPTFAAISPAWRTLRVLRLLRALRAFRLIRYSKSIDAVVRVLVSQRHLLLTVGGFAAAYVVVCAMVVFNCEPETFPSFFDALYWSVVSLTTVGYGDLYPVTEIGRAVAMLSSLVGIAVVALPSGIITAGMIDELNGKEHTTN